MSPNIHSWDAEEESPCAGSIAEEGLQCHEECSLVPFVSSPGFTQLRHRAIYKSPV